MFGDPAKPTADTAKGKPDPKRFGWEKNQVEIEPAADDKLATAAVVAAAEAFEGGDPEGAAGDYAQRSRDKEAARTGDIHKSPALTDPPSAWNAYLERVAEMRPSPAEQERADRLVDAYQTFCDSLGFLDPFFDISDEDFAAALDGEGAAGKAEDPFSATDDGWKSVVEPGGSFFAYLEVREAELLAEWAAAVGIPKPLPASEIHLTTCYSEAAPTGYQPSSETETVDGQSCSLGFINDDTLVMFVDSKLAWSRWLAAIDAGAVPSFPTMIPHITLSYDAAGFELTDHMRYLEQFHFTIGPEHAEGPTGSTKAKRPKKRRRKPKGKPVEITQEMLQAAVDKLNDEILREKVEPSLEDVIRDFGNASFDEIDIQLSFDIRLPAVEEFLERTAGDRIKDMVGETTRRELGAALAKVNAEGPTMPKLIEAVQQTFDRADKVRAEVIARTESTRAAGFGAQTAMDQANVERKMWLSSRDAFVRDAHSRLDGQIVEAEAPFTYEGDEAMFPGGFGKPALDINCRCISIPVPDEAAASRYDTEEKRASAWSAREQLLEHHTRILADKLREGFNEQRIAVLQALARATVAT